MERPTLTLWFVLVLLIGWGGAQDRTSLAKKHLAQGVAFLQAGQPEKAEAELRSVIELDPRNAQAFTILGSMYDDRGDHENAHTFFLRAIDAEPAMPAAYNNLGINCLRQNRIGEARQAFNKALELDSRSMVAHYNLGLLLMSSGETGKSITHLEQARQLKAGDPGILFNLAKAYFQAGNLSSAIPILRDLDHEPTSARLAEVQNLLGTALGQQGEVDEAIAHLTKAIELDPKGSDHHYKLALVLQKKGKLDEALEQARKAISLQIQPSAPQHFALGMIHEAKGEVDQASLALKRALEIAPDAEATRFALAVLLRNAGRYQEAIREFERLRAVRSSDSLEMDLAKTYYLAGDFASALDSLKRISHSDSSPRRADYYKLLAQVYNKTEHWPEALESLEKAIELEPRNSGLYFDLGLVLVNLNALQQAEQLFLGVLKHLPESPEIHVGLAQALMFQDHYPEALEALHRAIRLNANYSEAQYLLGNSLSETNQYAEARRAYQEAIRLSPDRDDFHFSFASLLEKLGDESAALTEFDKVVSLNETSADGHFRLGRLYLQKADYQHAEAHLRKAIELKPKDPQGYDQLARIYLKTGRTDDAQLLLAKLQELKKQSSEQQPLSLSRASLKPVDQYLRFLKH